MVLFKILFSINIGPAESIAPAVKKGDKALLDWVNGEIAAMKKDGRLKVAYEKTLLPVYGDKVKPEELLARISRHPSRNDREAV